MICQWVVQQLGTAYIRLLSRGGRVAEASLAASLAATAACIRSEMVDAGSPGDAASSLGAASAEIPAVQAVLHASGVLADSLLDKQSASSFRQVSLGDRSTGRATWLRLLPLLAHVHLVLRGCILLHCQGAAPT